MEEEKQPPLLLKISRIDNAPDDALIKECSATIISDDEVCLRMPGIREVLIDGSLRYNTVYFTLTKQIK